MSTTNQQLDDLLKRVQEGIASPEDYQQLRTFINNDTSGEVITRVHAFHASNSKDIIAAEAYDSVYWNTIVHAILQADKAGIQDTAQPDVNSAPVRRLYLSRHWGWVAAAVLILLAGGAYLFNQQTHTASTPALPVVQRKEDIMPGKNGAQLTLSDGKTIVLDSLANGVIAIQGNTDVQLQNGRLAYNKNDQASVRNVVTYNTLRTPRGSQYQVVLPDGTKVWLNAASSIRFPTQFTGAVRETEIAGEAYLEVAKNAAMPFRVKVNKSTIEVLGTHFNINAYSDEPVIRTTLLEGSVKVAKEAVSVILKPGEQAIIKTNQPLSIDHSPDLDQVMAWKNGRFYFNDADIQTVMRQVSRWYDVEVAYEGKIPDEHFNGKPARDVPLSQMLTILQYTGVKYSIQGKKIIIKE